MQKYFKTEVPDTVFAHAKSSLENKEQIVKEPVKQMNPFQEIDDRNNLLETIRQQLAAKSDGTQKLIKKPVAQTK
jgi:hypothetical protein